MTNQTTTGGRGQLGTTGGLLGGTGTNLGGLASTTSGLNQQNRAFGASSIGTRRSPTYMTVPAFTSAEQRQNIQQPIPTIRVAPTAAMKRDDLQTMISGSSRLPSRESIKVSMGDDGVVVLRGTVKDERERRMAEAMLKASGVIEVRNELQRGKK